MVAETSSDGEKLSVKTKNIYLGDTLIATVDTTGSTITPVYYLTDHLGSTEKTLSATGTILSTLDYYPYGEQRTQSGTQPKRAYIGEEYDPSTNYNYLNARYTDSTRGQFLSQDPVFWEVGETKDGQAVLTNPQALNSYLYANGNPVGNKDPSGRIVPLAVVAGYALEALGAGLTAYSAYNVGSAYYNGTQDQLTVWDYTGAVPGFAFVKAGSVVTNSAKVISGGQKANNLLKAVNDLNKVNSINKSIQYATTDAKLKHIFSKSEHNLEKLVEVSGGQKSAIEDVVNQLYKQNLPTGSFKDVTVKVGSQDVTVRGVNDNGLIKIGTMFVKK